MRLVYSRTSKWTTIMTIANNDLSALAQQALSGGDVPAGLPDAAELTRLANQFFQALPGDTPAIDAVSPTTAPALQIDQIPAGFDARPGIDESAISALVQQSFGLSGVSGLQSLAAPSLNK